MTHVSAWALAGALDRALLKQLRVLLCGIDPVPPAVLMAASSLGQRIVPSRRVMANTVLIG
ncbi:hypothetical protein [Kutzneria sp. 744]|uniref:hypothetical protein n=1 Tax=Kutzneria sp. (strain 744) TaxID=345341 RepID=UPI0004BC39F4|nr:hypothetical protein [Kutzneria sp. 744]